MISTIALTNTFIFASFNLKLQYCCPGVEKNKMIYLCTNPNICQVLWSVLRATLFGSDGSIRGQFLSHWSEHGCV